MQPSIMTTATVLHFVQSWAPSGYSESEPEGNVASVGKLSTVGQSV